jgi:hypothetical protein
MLPEYKRHITIFGLQLPHIQMNSYGHMEISDNNELTDIDNMRIQTKQIKHLLLNLSCMGK